jgi:FkbM family methyltransferase
MREAHMDMQLWFYSIMTNTALPDFPGKWRLKRAAKNLVKDRYYKVPYRSGWIWVCPVHAMGKQVFEGQVYEPVLVDIIRAFVRAQFSFIDIGANIGLHTVAAALEKAAENQFFIAFEPEPINYSWLSKNCQTNNLSFVICKQEALGDKDDFLTLNISTTLNKGNHSLLVREGTVGGEKVKVSILDKFLADSPFAPNIPVLIKLDVEGFEWPVLEGGMQFLKALNDVVLICEVTPKTLAVFGKSIHDLQNRLKDVGFERRAVLMDEDSFNDAGEKISDFYNMIFTKGPKSYKILASLQTGILSDVSIL